MASKASSRLFEPLKVGKLTLSNRLVLAPMTRLRASDDHVPLPAVAEYYAQRGSVPGTLLVTEATFISPNASGYANVPGIWNAAQIEGWRTVTSAVHAKGSHIFLQLWALGRTATPAIKEAEGTGDVVSASAISMGEGGATPRPLTETEIAQYVREFADAARNAVEAGFDGVEIHGANGYLVDQFLQDVSNERTDRYGGSIENRSRFAVEVAKAVVEAVGAERTAIRLSPWGTFQGMRMAEPLPQFTHVMRELAALKLAYVHLVEARLDGQMNATDRSDVSDPLIEVWGQTSPVILAGGFNAAIAKETVDDEYKHLDVAIAFGRPFLSTPDLVFRVERGLAFNEYNRGTFYVPKGVDGYVDYPFSEEFLKEHPQKAAA